MRFSELARLLEENGFRVVKETCSISYYGKPAWNNLIRADFHGSTEVLTGTCRAGLKAAGSNSLKENGPMIDLPYSLIIEATEELDYFGFYSTKL